MMIPPVGVLDGFTIYRFVHAFGSGGGVERLMEDLDTTLLQRNAMTIVRMYWADASAAASESTEDVGRGSLVHVRCQLPEGEQVSVAVDNEEHHSTFRQYVRDRILCNPAVWALGGRAYVLRRKLHRRRGEIIGAGGIFAGLCDRFAFDLCMMHFFGGSDADEVIQLARKRRIPVGLQNHYSNDRFLHLAIRKHAILSDAVAGVNGRDIPPYLARVFVNLGDGIDMTRFVASTASRPLEAPSHALLLLPARIVRPKGQMDVLRVAARLRREGIEVSVAFAGRVDSPVFYEELHREVLRTSLESRVLFLGELTPENLRDWYSASSLTVFPTYHHEGLPRIVLESQAMGVPVVAYSTGGIAEGVIDGTTGCLVPTGDVDALFSKVSWLLKDESQRLKMSDAGRRFVQEKYSLDAVAARHEQFYLSLGMSRRIVSDSRGGGRIGGC